MARTAPATTFRRTPRWYSTWNCWTSARPEPPPTRDPKSRKRAPARVRAWSLPAGRRFAPLLANDRLLARVDDRLHHAVDIRDAFVELELAGELGIRVQLAQFIQRPHFLAVVRIQQFRREARQADADIAHVTAQHRARIVVARRTDCLRQIDDHRTVRPDQHVVFGQVAVDQPHA